MIYDITGTSYTANQLILACVQVSCQSYLSKGQVNFQEMTKKKHCVFNTFQRKKNHFTVNSLKSLIGHVETSTCFDPLFLCCDLGDFCVLCRLIITQDKPTPPIMRLAQNTLTDIHQSMSLSCQVGSLLSFEDCAEKDKFFLD